jgi:type II secretory pathway component GspD/PulD (secretin)
MIMRKTIFTTATVLLAGFAFAQQQSESVEGVLNELDTYQGAEAQAPAVETEAMPAVAEAPVDVPAVIEDSREAYAMGEFERAQLGFERVIAAAPENLVARMYLRKIKERDYRTVELSGMDAVPSAWDTSLVLRSYPISPDAAEKMELGDVEGPLDISAKFPEVDFPEGTAAMYQPKMEKIFVRNTVENLTVIEEVLDAMDVAKTSADVEQVEIEAKFVEVAEGALEALGFEWTIGDTITGIGNGTEIPAGQGLFDDGLRGTGGSALPFSQPSALGAGTAAASGAWSTFNFEDTFSSSADTLTLSHTDFSAVINALDQTTGTDVLSAPRIVTKSGEEAVIRVGEKHIFPEVYEPNASGGNIVHVKYEDWEEKLLGVELTVTPQVDGDQIEMELNPKITELQGWQTYDIAGANSAYTWYQFRVGLKFNHAALQAQLPIFRVRNIETEVTIADGATIGMGGLVNEKIEAYEDKVPVLGSMPLIGRLFRSEGERAVKRNLVMFVTAKKVEPTGRINSTRSFQ